MEAVESTACKRFLHSFYTDPDNLGAGITTNQDSDMDGYW